MALMLFFYNSKAKKAISSFNNLVSSAGLKIYFAAFFANQSSDAGQLYSYSFSLKLLINIFLFNAAAAFGTRLFTYIFFFHRGLPLRVGETHHGFCGIYAVTISISFLFE